MTFYVVSTSWLCVYRFSLRGRPPNQWHTSNSKIYYLYHSLFFLRNVNKCKRAWHTHWYQSYDNFWKHRRYRDDVQARPQGRYSYCLPPRSPAPRDHWALVEYWWSEWLSEVWRRHRDNGGPIAKGHFCITPLGRSNTMETETVDKHNHTKLPASAASQLNTVLLPLYD